jgi:hypothetical protein
MIRTHGLTHLNLIVRDLRRGDFGPGLPYVFVQDPDGHEIEIWYE